MEKKICIKNSCGKIYTPENDEEYETRTCCGICGAPVEVDLGDYPYEIVEEERIVKKIESLPGEGPRILIYKGREIAEVVNLEYDETIIGRQSINSIPDIDMTSIDEDRNVSRQHAMIYKEDGNFYLRKLSALILYITYVKISYFHLKIHHIHKLHPSVIHRMIIVI